MLEVKCGKVTLEERDEIQGLYYKKLALSELFQALAKTDNISKINGLYEKALSDMGETSAKFNGWWDKISKKYGWRMTDELTDWKIKFEECEVFLVQPK